jgi:membrane fusion protein (multidrug efflux system)
VSPATDLNSTTIEIWAQAANANGQLRPGTNVQLSLIPQKVENALVVPAVAILDQPEGGHAVMVAGPDNRAHLHAIQIGIRTNDQVQVTSGLQVGQRVITSGAYGLPDNTKVKVEEPNKATHD